MKRDAFLRRRWWWWSSAVRGRPDLTRRTGRRRWRWWSGAVRGRPDLSRRTGRRRWWWWSGAVRGRPDLSRRTGRRRWRWWSGAVRRRPDLSRRTGRRRWRWWSGAVRGRPDLTRRAGRRWLLRLLGFGHHRGLRLYPCSAASAAPTAAVGQDKHRRKQNGANRGSIQRKRGADAAPALKSSAHPGPVTVLFPSCNHHVAFRSIRPLPSVVVSLDFV